jgi:hypothetical protein
MKKTDPHGRHPQPGAAVPIGTFASVVTLTSVMRLLQPGRIISP